MPNHDKPLIRQCSYTEVVGGSNNTFQINNFGPNKTWSERSLSLNFVLRTFVVHHNSVESEKMDVDDSCAENLEADHRVKTARRLNDISIKPKQQMNIDHFKKIKLKFEEKFPMIANVILFNNLNRNTVEKWLRLQIKERGLSNEEEIISSLLEKYDVEVYGFKGLIPKINIFEL
ncbi:hypothetical protein Trydic_g20596 [Trypoxylus dichotomus]